MILSREHPTSFEMTSLLLSAVAVTIAWLNEGINHTTAFLLIWFLILLSHIGFLVKRESVAEAQRIAEADRALADAMAIALALLKEMKRTVK